LRLVEATAVEFGFCFGLPRMRQRSLSGDEDCASGLSSVDSFALLDERCRVLNS
jgi:hypothetical protein